MTSFEYFVCNNHTTCCDCQCGKVWFTRHDDEIETLRQNARDDGDKYVESEDDAVAFGWLSGQQFVFGCDCGFAKRHEDWIISHELEIREFLRARGQERLKEAEELAAIV